MCFYIWKRLSAAQRLEAKSSAGAMRVGIFRKRSRNLCTYGKWWLYYWSRKTRRNARADTAQLVRNDSWIR